MTWKQALGRVAPVCILLAGCSMGNSVTIVDHTTITKGQSVQQYKLVNVDTQGRAEFSVYDRPDGLGPRHAHIVAAPGEIWSDTQRSDGRTSIHQYEIVATDPAKQQATVLAKVTFPPK